MTGKIDRFPDYPFGTLFRFSDLLLRLKIALEIRPVVLDQHIWYQINPQDLSFQTRLGCTQAGREAKTQMMKF